MGYNKFNTQVDEHSDIKLQKKIIKLSGDTWDEIKDHPFIIKSNIANIYESITNIEFYKLTIEGEMDLDDTNNIYLNGIVNINGIFKYYDMGDYDRIEDKNYINHNLNIAINYKDNIIDGEYNIIINKLDGDEKGELYLKYLYYENNYKVIGIEFFADNLNITYYNMDEIYKNIIFFYKENFNESLFICYPEIKYSGTLGEKLKFINNLLDGFYKDDFERGNISIYYTEEQFCHYIKDKSIEYLYDMYNDKIINLKLKDNKITFSFKRDNNKHLISLIHYPYFTEKSPIDLVIHDENKIELYASKFKENAYESFDKAMNDIHILGKILGFKQVYLYDHANKDIKGEKLPISLVRKLAGDSFFYEKYGYYMEDDINEIEDDIFKIEDDFNNFCERNISDDLNITIRDYFELINHNRDHKLCDIFTGILNYIFNLPDNEALFKMNYMISHTPFYKTL